MAVEEDVVALDVVVGDAAGVGVGEGAGDAEEGRHLSNIMEDGGAESRQIRPNRRQAAEN